MRPKYTGRLHSRSEAIRQLDTLMQNAPQVLIVHYACEGFETAHGQSARISAIAVSNLACTQSHSFSIFQAAELQGVAPAQIAESYAELERQMLGEFYEFVQQHQKHKWVHWSMRDVHYGFPALAHRYRLLGGMPVTIADESLYDLSKLLSGKYSSSYMRQPRLRNIIDRNQLSLRDHLDGAEEAAAFAAGNFQAVLRSTLRKVDTLANILERAASDRLRHDASVAEVYGLSAANLTVLVKEHPVFVAASIVVVLVTLVLRLDEVFSRWVTGHLGL